MIKVRFHCIVIGFISDLTCCFTPLSLSISTMAINITKGRYLLQYFSHILCGETRPLLYNPCAVNMPSINIKHSQATLLLITAFIHCKCNFSYIAPSQRLAFCWVCIECLPCFCLQDLVDELKSELGGKFETLIVSLMMPPTIFDATQLRDAIKVVKGDVSSYFVICLFCL